MSEEEEKEDLVWEDVKEWLKEEEEYKERAENNSPGGPDKAACVATLRQRVRSKG